MHKFLIHNRKDSVGVAVVDIGPGERVTGVSLEDGRRVELAVVDPIPCR